MVTPPSPLPPLLLPRLHARRVSPQKKPPVCTLKTSPCVPAPRAACVQNMRAWCRYTRGRFESTHGGFFLRATPHTAHNTRTTHHHTETDRETGTERDREKQRKREQDRTRQEKKGKEDEKRPEKKRRSEMKEETREEVRDQRWKKRPEKKRSEMKEETREEEIRDEARQLFFSLKITGPSNNFEF